MNSAHYHLSFLRVSSNDCLRKVERTLNTVILWSVSQMKEKSSKSGSAGHDYLGAFSLFNEYFWEKDDSNPVSTSASIHTQDWW